MIDGTERYYRVWLRGYRAGAVMALASLGIRDLLRLLVSRCVGR